MVGKGRFFVQFVGETGPVAICSSPTAVDGLADIEAIIVFADVTNIYINHTVCLAVASHIQFDISLIIHIILPHGKSSI